MSALRVAAAALGVMAAAVLAVSLAGLLMALGLG